MASERSGSAARTTGELSSPFVSATAESRFSSVEETSQYKKHLSQLRAHRARAIANFRRRRQRRRKETMRAVENLHQTLQNSKEELQESLRAGMGRAQACGDPHAVATARRREVLVNSFLVMVHAAVGATSAAAMSTLSGGDDEEDDYDDDAMAMAEDGNGVDGEEPVFGGVRRTLTYE